MWNALNSILQSMGNVSMTPQTVELNRNIENAREAVRSRPNDPYQLDLLGNYLGVRYSTSGSLDDLNESIRLARDAIEAASAEDPSRSRYINSLVVGLGDRNIRTGDPEDLDEACQKGQEAVDLTPLNDHPQETWSNNLAIALASRHELSGKESDLEEAIQIARRVLAATGSDHPLRARRLNTLANRLADRFAKTRAQADLEESIRNAHEAAALTPDGHLDQKGYLNNLALLYGDLYTRTGSLETLNDAITVGQKVLDATDVNDPSRAVRLSNLGIQLRYRYVKTGQIDDLDKCIQHLREAINRTDPSNPDRAQWLNNLGDPLGEKFELTRAASVAQEAVEISRQAVAALPIDHLNRATCLNTLGNRLAELYTCTQKPADLAAVISSYRSALHQSSSAVLDRILAGKQVLRYHALKSDWQQAYEDAETAMGLVPRLTKRSLGNSDKQYVLGQIVGLAGDATAAALNAGKEPSVALSLLEQGRGVLAAFLQEMRTDLMDLRASHPALADNFVRLRSVLNTPNTSSMSFGNHDRQAPSLDDADTRSRAEAEFDALLLEVRRQQGFEGFLLSPNEEELKKAGSHGPIIVINVSELRCDALLVETSGIRCATLSSLNVDSIETQGRQGDRGSPGILSHLWDTVAEPVLAALGFTHPPSGDDWPHIWWIPTGRLSKFPLHAAGYHDKNSVRTVMDRVVSSYNSSVKTIIQGRRRHIPDVTSAISPKALLIDMAQTPGHSPLEFAAAEVSLVNGICQGSSCEVILPTRKKAEVMSHLSSCSILHFAGHGSTNKYDPSSSSLLLEDCKENPLTVADLMEKSLHDYTPFLAYLSACGTGDINDEKYFDESIHLISACQLAGFRHVIGTLWEVEDESCLSMARIAYEEIIHQRMTDASVSLGLHKAARGLREDLRRSQASDTRAGPSIGNSKTVLGATMAEEHTTSRTAFRRNQKAKPLPWVPYVHFGV